jgi:hypothetical protein
VCGGVGVAGEAVGVAFGGIGGAIEEAAHDVALGVGELGYERVDLRHVRRPGVGCPGGDRRREPFVRGCVAFLYGRTSADELEGADLRRALRRSRVRVPPLARGARRDSSA